jgi:hypothetical protein
MDYPSKYSIKTTILLFVVLFSVQYGYCQSASSPNDLVATLDSEVLIDKATNSSITSEARFSNTREYASLAHFLAQNVFFPESAVHTGRYGSLKASIEVLEDGKIGQITILDSPGPEFDEAFILAANELPKMKPALINSVAVSSRQVVQLNFKLR